MPDRDAGAIGSISTAVTVAASSFSMTITDPTPLLDALDHDRLNTLLKGTSHPPNLDVEYVEPPETVRPKEESLPRNSDQGESTAAPDSTDDAGTGHVIQGRVQTLGDFIDTDALAPAEALMPNFTPEQVGQYCLVHTHPDFRRRIREDGHNIVVAGKAFGVGSSRENAVTALQGAGVQCVIAQSFAFIYARNQPNLGMLGIVITDEAFYEAAIDGAEIAIDVDARQVHVAGKTFGFSLSDLEMALWRQGGVSKAFARWGKQMLEEITTPPRSSLGRRLLPETGDDLKW
jgi:3-isopropylmalate dehydratase small subunit